MAELPATMRGAVLLGPESIEVREVPLPRPGPGELILRVDAATTCGTDVKVFRRGGHPRMLQVPTLFGHEVAGTVAATGAGVTRFAEGDRLVVANSASCGSCRACRAGRENLCADLRYLNGAFAEYLHVPAAFVARSAWPIPPGLDAARAALAEPLACVLHGLEACELERLFPGARCEAIVLGAGPIGLLFVAALARAGVRTVVADPNPPRLRVALDMGASDTLAIERGGGQAERLRALAGGGDGADVVVECTGAPAVWEDALEAVRPGGLVNLFGGCAPGTAVSLDTHRLHYSEITVKGVYHHRPATFARALEQLADPSFPAAPLLSGSAPIEGVESALRRMMRREALKIVVRGGAAGAA